MKLSLLLLGYLSSGLNVLTLTCLCYKGTCKVVNVLNQEWLLFQYAAAIANACDNKKFSMF